MFAKVKNNTVVEFPIEDIRKRFPNTSFPSEITEETQLPEGFVKVFHQYVHYEPLLERLQKRELPEFDGAKWIVSFNKIKLTEFQLHEIHQQRLNDAKAVRTQDVLSLVVTTLAGNTFDGDENSQNRMSRAITAMEETDTIPWVLADNTIATVIRAELKEALKLAGAAMAEIWVRPYQL